MILEYKIACDNCNCIIDGMKEKFIEEAVQGDPDYGLLNYCNQNCQDGKVCQKCHCSREEGMSSGRKLKRYLCSAVSSGTLVETIKAYSKEQAEEKFDKDLENGLVPETEWGGCIDDIQVEEVKEEGEKK